jgi:hypothetical protein
LAIAGSLTVMGASLMQLSTLEHSQQLAQVQTVPSDHDDSAKPSSETKPSGTRPTTPPPQPARPDANAQNKGAKPALPPAPAEKSAPPIDAK